MSAHVVDVGEREFEAAVVQRSWETPVVVDFWAPWCGPCRTLGPLLERLAAEHAGAFLLAKVNIDESPALAQALQIQSVPMVLGFRDGQVVAEFVGALPEAEVRAFLSRVLPSAADNEAAAAFGLLEAGNIAEAEAKLRHALELDPRCELALLGLARVMAERGDGGAATALLDRILPGPLRAEADRLAAEIRIRGEGGGDEGSLRRKLEAEPGDLATRLQLGRVLAAASRHAEALEEFLEIVRRDRKFEDGAARRAMIDIFDLLGSGNELVDRYRSELAKVLFS